MKVSKIKHFALFLSCQKWYNMTMAERQSYSRKELKQLNKNELCNMVLAMQESDVQKDEVIASKDTLINILTQEVQLLRAKKYGRKSEISIAERVENGQMVIDEVMDLIFNEAEAIVDTNEGEKETTVKEHTRKTRSKGKLAEDISKMRVEVEHHRMSDEELEMEFPDGYREFGVDITHTIECIPADYYAVEHHVHKYCDKKDSSHIVRAKGPDKLFDTGLATASVASDVFDRKFTNAMPFYRIEKDFERRDIPITRQNMAIWAVMASERYFSLVVDRLHEILMSFDVNHADETPVRVTKDGRKAGAKSYMWVYCSNKYDPRRIVIFDYHKTRHHSHPEEFLKDFNGILVTDGFEVYHLLERLRNGEIIVAGCWVHLNRKFKDALKGLGKSGKNTAAGSIAQEAVDKIGKIFHLDNKLDDVSAEVRLKVRQEKIKPLVDEFFEWIKKHRSDVALKSLTGKAITYALNQEKYLRVFLDHGNVPMENNTAEVAIRPFCIGKKNWLMSDTIHGAEASAVIYSIVETAKANGLIPYEYMKYLLEEIPKHMDNNFRDTEFIDDLLPWSDKLPDKCRKPSNRTKC